MRPFQNVPECSAVQCKQELFSNGSHSHRTHPLYTRVSNMAIWSDEETHKLIEIWGEDNIQAMLKGSRRNKEVYARISKEMEMAGYKKTTVQKLKNYVMNIGRLKTSMEKWEKTGKTGSF